MKEQRQQKGKNKPAFMNVVLVVLLSVISGSFAGPFMRIVLNDGITGVWVACLRMVAMVIVVWTAVVFNKKLRQSVLHIDINKLLWIFLAGIFLACHFFTLALSIQYASIFGSVSIFSTQYLFTVVIAAVFLKEKPGKGALVGILMSIAGIFIISWTDFKQSGDITGSIYALVSALFYSAYFVAGRYIRQNIKLGAYTVWVNTFCAILVTAAAFAINQPFKPLNIGNIAVFFGLALFGSLGGHIGINWALKFIPSDVPSIIVLSQPVYSAVLAYLFFNEKIRLETALGALFILSGIAVYIFIRRRYKKDLVLEKQYE